jgi:hypothetical protein
VEEEAVKAAPKKKTPTSKAKKAAAEAPVEEEAVEAAPKKKTPTSKAKKAAVEAN